MKKILATLLSLTLVLGMFTGCGSDDSSTSSNSDGTNTNDTGEVKEISVWHLYGESEEPTSPHQRYLDWADVFNENHDDIQVKVSGGKTADVILTTIAAGSTPDIFMNYWNNAPTWSDAGAIYDLTDYVNNDSEWDKADFIDNSWDVATYNGNIYSIPNTYSSTYIFYRKDLLADAGWDEFPKNMDELAQCVRDTTIVGDDGKLVQMGMIPNYPWFDTVLFGKTFNADFIDKDTNTITYNSPEMLEALNWQNDIIQEYGYDTINYFKDGLGARATAEDPLLTGKLAMRWGPESQLSALEEYGVDVDWAVAPFPTTPENIGMFTSNVWEMNAKTKDPDAAWTVLASLTSKENYINLAAGEFNKGAFFSRKSAIEWTRDEAEVSDNTKFVANYLLEADLTSFPMLSYINEYLNASSVEMEKVFTGDQTVEEAADNVVEQIQPIADENPYVE